MSITFIEVDGIERGDKKKKYVTVSREKIA